MDQQNYISLELNLKFQMKDYRLVLGVKKMGVVFALTLLAQAAHILWGYFAS